MDANVKEWLTSPVVAGRLDEIGRSLERRRVIKEEEEDSYPIPTNVFRTLNAARRGVGAGVNTLLGDAPQRFRRKTRVFWWTLSEDCGGVNRCRGRRRLGFIGAAVTVSEDAVEGEGRQWAGLDWY